MTSPGKPTTTPTNLARKAAGTFVPDHRPQAGTLAWFQEQCRTGEFRPVLEQFCRDQPEMLYVDRVMVETVHPDYVQGYIPYAARDHESRSPFICEVLFHLNPITQACVRVSV